ncbi:hypothetical protein RND81_14G146800 [Saponaria officinalis]|uniref:ATP-dependent DNA helicase n=1 Tax=Saponaria officinalis TaxID=3572 RepID=A0AAW1GQG5_SAPOF
MLQRVIYLTRLISSGVFTSVWNFGRPTESCELCDAALWKEESVGNVSENGQLQFSICFQKGKVKLPLLQDPPEYLKERLIHSYNTIYALTSMGGKVDNAVNQGSSPYCFRLSGQNHHNIGSFLPPDGKQPRFLQLYFYDGESEVAHRITSLSARGKNELDPEIVEGLSKMLYEHNALAMILQPVQHRLIGNRSMDGRQYNLPSSDELAVLIVGGSDSENCNRDIVIYDRSKDGYRLDIKHSDAETTTRKKRTFVTMRKYYAFRFQDRRKHEKIIDGISVLCGRLRQQFMVDAFTCVEETQLNYIRKYSLCGLIDAIASSNISPGTLGQSMILPASFSGCFRFLFQNYQDTLAICRWAGPPDLFITFTCNPKWVEIEEFLAAHPGQRPEDRPDIVARVFKIKLDALIHDLTKDAFFGRVLAVIYTIEFQKRGLPHAHICLFLHPSDKHKDPADIDKIISAEIPDKDIDPVGLEAMNYRSPCMVDGKCSNEDGYPQYHRRVNGRTAEKSGHTVDNRFIVPHNIDLLVKYDAHLNVEWCNKHRSIKYLFKYMSKGSDMALAAVEQVEGDTPGKPVDEIETFLRCRYVSASEACWRMFAFEIQFKRPPVQSYADIRTVNGVIHPTYKAACVSLGLLDGDDEWNTALNEAATWSTAHQLRDLFVTLLLFCEVSDPKKLWETHWENLLKQFSDLPMPDLMLLKMTDNRLIMEERDYDKQEMCVQANQMQAGLNDEQKTVYETVLEAVRSKGGGHIVLVVASSGIAALLLLAGRTAHSRFAIPLNLSDSTSCKIDQGSKLAQLIRKASLVIWDEAPMVYKHAFEAVDRAFRDIMHFDDPTAKYRVFGGKTVVLDGDFRHILPVVPRKGRVDIVDASISKSAQIWPHCNVLKLKKNMRLTHGINEENAAELAEFTKWVLDIGDGKIPTTAKLGEDEKTWISIPEDMLIENTDDPIASIVEEVYPQLLEKYTDPLYLQERAILAPKNDNAEQVNNYILRLIPGEEVISKSVDRICPLTKNASTMENIYPTVFLNSLKFQGLPNHEMHLKIGCPIIVLRNINQAKGLCNETRLTITKILSRIIEAKVLTGSNAGTIVSIPRIEMTPTDTTWPFTIKRRQFPIKVCFSMTINKSQGQTFEKVGVYLPEPVFSHGQFGLNISLPFSGVEEAYNRKTRNVVYKEIYSDL